MDNISSIDDLVTKRTTEDEATRQGVRFNVGGHMYEVSRDVVMKHPDTMLARISSDTWHADPTKEIFINGDGDRFRYVINYLNTGRIILPSVIPKAAILEDLEYYGFDAVNLDDIDDSSVDPVGVASYLITKAEEVDSRIETLRKGATYLLVSLKCFQHYCAKGSLLSIPYSSFRETSSFGEMDYIRSSFDRALFDKYLAEYGLYFVSNSGENSFDLGLLSRKPEVKKRQSHKPKADSWIRALFCLSNSWPPRKTKTEIIRSDGEGIKHIAVGEAAVKRVRFNVGGLRYEISRDIIMANPDTMLARKSLEAWQLDPANEVFIDGDGDRFRYVLDYLRTGRIILPSVIPKEMILKDLKYYGFVAVNLASISGSSVGPGGAASYLINKAKDVDSRVQALRRKATFLQVSLICLQQYCANGRLSIPYISFDKEGLSEEMKSFFGPSFDRALFDKCLAEYGFVSSSSNAIWRKQIDVGLLSQK